MAKGKQVERGPASRQKASEAIPKGKSYFLGIGIDKYKNPHQFATLSNAVFDVKEISDKLYEYFEFDEEPTLLINDAATRSQIYNTLFSYTGKLDNQDKLLIYFAGHGEIKKLKDTEYPYWAPFDADTGDPSTLLGNEAVKELLEKCPAKHIFLISDSCHSGTFLRTRSVVDYPDLNEELTERYEAKGSRWVLCSADENQLATDGYAGLHTPFAKSLLEFFETHKSSRINVGFLIDWIVKSAFEINNAQLGQGGELQSIRHKRGQYVFWPRKTEPPSKIIQPQGIELIEPLPHYRVDPSIHTIIPSITLKTLIMLEKSLRMSCQLMLDRFAIPVHMDKWTIKSVCEQKLHTVYGILTEVDVLVAQFDDYVLTSEYLFTNTKSIHQQVVSQLSITEFDYFNSLESDELSFFVFDSLESLHEKTGECLQILKKAFNDNMEMREHFRLLLLDANLNLKKIFLTLEKVIDTAEEHELPDPLHN
ncbi:MAG TPA: caspase family protein [Flavilitoribacter sp.]|nr:caspase family protein [Flavilitoribacter sp.]